MDRLTVSFHAADGGTFPLTWGQQHIWKPLRWYGPASSYFTIPAVIDLPDGGAGLTRATVARALRRLVERNQSLRTRFRGGDGGFRQHIAPAGTLTVPLHQATPDGSRAAAGHAAGELAAAPFDHASEWPLRAALICAGNTPRQLAVAVSHTATDGAGMQALIGEFLALLAVPPGGPLPPRRWQPVSQVKHERSRRGARRHQGAAAYWRKHLAQAPPSMFDFPAARPAQPRFRRLRLESPALARAVTRLAVRCDVSRSTVLLTGAGLALATLSGHSTAVLKLVVSNRFEERTRDAIASVTQDGLLVAGYDGGSVTDAVRATSKAARAGYYYGAYDPAALDTLIAGAAAERGVHFDLTAYFNDLTDFMEPGPADGEPDAADTSPRTVRGLLARTVVEPEGAWETQDSKFFFATECDASLCRLHLLGDTAYLPVPVLETVLRGVETMLVEAAYRDVRLDTIPALTGITPVRRGPGWRHGPDGWVDLTRGMAARSAAERDRAERDGAARSGLRAGGESRRADHRDHRVAAGGRMIGQEEHQATVRQ